MATKKCTYKFPKLPLGGSNTFTENKARVFKQGYTVPCEWGSIHNILCVCVYVCVYAHLACTPVPLYVSWLLSVSLYRSSLCDSGCVLVSVYLCLRASGQKRVCMCYAYAHASLVSDGPRLWLPVLRTLSSLFILSPQLSRQHQGFVCLLVLFYGFLFCLFCFIHTLESGPPKLTKFFYLGFLLRVKDMQKRRI